MREQQPPQMGGDGGRQRRAQDIFRAETVAWAAVCLGTDAPFRERLVAFWANHFSVSRRSRILSALTGH